MKTSAVGNDYNILVDKSYAISDNKRLVKKFNENYLGTVKESSGMKPFKVRNFFGHSNVKSAINHILEAFETICYEGN